jgi:hypothetical protein
MNNKTMTLLALAISIAGFYAPSTQAYFKTIEGVNNLETRHVVPTTYYNLGTDRFRSQAGRNITSSSPTTGTYDRRTNRSIASDEMAKGSIRSLFAYVGLSQDNLNPHYDNNAYNDSKIKFRSLTSHTCFEPVGSEITRCKKRFGSFYSLKKSILNGSIYAILVENNAKVSQNIEPLFKDMVAEITKNNIPVKPTQTTEVKTAMRDRMQTVWDLCKQQTASHMDAAKCYIRNDRQYLDN